MSAELVSLMTAFTFVFLAELGDKTQLAAMALSSKSSALHVFAGSMLAFFAVDGISILIGGELLGFLPYDMVCFASGLIFVFFGVFSLIRKTDAAPIENQKATLIRTFSIVFLMELGDKTQFASIALVAQLKNPLLTLMGVMLAFSVVTAVGVICGAKLLRLLPEKSLRVGAAALFVLFGVLFILSAIN